MDNSLSLRQQLILTAHRWPVVVAFILAGAFAGWLVTWVWPSSYRASAAVLVGLDTYRALEDRNAEQAAHLAFNFPDDYKNWQMNALNAFIYSPGVVHQTLQELRDTDNYWDNVRYEELLPMLDAYWRNAGQWRLTAEHPNRRRAVQAATAWRDVVVRSTHEAVGSARATLMTDIQIQALADEQARLLGEQAGLETLQQKVASLQSQAASQPGSAVDEDLRWDLWVWTGQAANFNPAWEPVQDAFPAETASAGEYAEWAARLQTLLEESVEQRQVRMAALEQERQILEAQYQESAQKSAGLSSTMLVESLSEGASEIETLRPAGMLILIGGSLGLLVWILLWLGRLALRRSA